MTPSMLDVYMADVNAAPKPIPLAGPICQYRRNNPLKGWRRALRAILKFLKY